VTPHLSFNKLAPQKGALVTLLNSKICQGIEPCAALCPPIILARLENLAFPQAENDKVLKTGNELYRRDDVIGKQGENIFYENKLPNIYLSVFVSQSDTLMPECFPRHCLPRKCTNQNRQPVH
jgi:hypothetical protein